MQCNSQASGSASKPISKRRRRVHLNTHESVDIYTLDNPPPKPYGAYAAFGFHSPAHKLSIQFANIERTDTRRADERIKQRTRAILGERDDA